MYEIKPENPLTCEYFSRCYNAIYDRNIYEGKSKFIHTLATTYLQVCQTAICSRVLIVGIIVVTWSKFDRDRDSFLAAVTV